MRAIRADVEIFTTWCKGQGFTALPARVTTVVAFIDAMAKVKAPATVRRYVSSIATVHKAVQLHNPLENTRVKLALQRMHRKKGRRQEQVKGLTWSLRQRLLNACAGRLIDTRNRALVAVAYDTLLRRSELVSLQVTDLLEEMDGSGTLLIRRGKTDPGGDGALLYLAPDSIKLVREWLARSGLDRRAAVSLATQGRSAGWRSWMPARCLASTRRWRKPPGWGVMWWRDCPDTVPVSGRFRI